MTETTPQANSPLSVLQLISTAQIQPSPYQTRKDFDEESIKRLADSMDKEGLIQPITVRKVGEFYELIAGERRLRAAKLLGWVMIEVRIVEVVSEAAASSKGLVENIQRKDLNPIEEALGFSCLNQLDPNHWNQGEIAIVSGKSRIYVNKSISLLSLPTSIQEGVRQRTLSREHGLELLRLQGHAKQAEVSKLAENGLTVKKTRDLIDMILKAKPKIVLKDAKSNSSDPYTALWNKTKEDPDIISRGILEISYSPRKVGPGHALYGWNFWLAPTGDDAKVHLAVLLRRITDAVAAEVDPEALKLASTSLAESQKIENNTNLPETTHESR